MNSFLLIRRHRNNIVDAALHASAWSIPAAYYLED